MTGFKTKVWMTALFSSILMLIIVTFGLRGINQVEQVKERWAAYQKTQNEAALTLNRIQSQLGYGGFIHDFKNFVLRRDPILRQMANDDIKVTLNHIKQYTQYEISQQEKRALLTLESVLKRYKSNLNLAAQMIEQNASPVTIDNRVRVDDTPALKAISVLSAMAIIRNQKSLEETEKAIDNAMKQFYWAAFVLPFILLLTIAIIVFLHRLNKANTAARKANLYYNKLFETSPDTMMIVAEDGQIKQVNDVATQMTGYSRQELIQMAVEDLMPDSIRHSHHHLRNRYFQAPKQRSMDGSLDIALQNKQGNAVPVDISLGYLSEDGHNVAIVSIRDMTVRRKQQHSLERSAAVFEKISDAVLISDANEKIISVNKAFVEITGYSEEESIGQNAGFTRSGRHDPEFFQQMRQSLQDHGHWQGEIWDRRKDGEIYPKWLTITYVDDSREPYYIGVFSDITLKKATEEKLRQLAFHDPLTGLLNRLSLTEQLDHAIKHSDRVKRPVGVLFIDLDNFKKINDSLGHQIGDELLKVIADRLTAAVHEDDVVARLGGDEFMIVAEEIEEPLYLEHLAQQLLKTVSEVVQYGDHELFVSPSIGISVYPRDGSNTTEMIKNADTAMYRAKHAGRNCFQFYSEELAEAAMKRLSLESDLRQALAEEQFEVYYQPQIDFATGAIKGAEALVRWIHPEKGMISPADFIPIAEDTRLIIPLGQWVLKQACCQLKRWHQKGYHLQSMGVNLAGPQITHSDICQQVTDVLQECDLDARYLELEITETFIMEHQDEAIPVLEQIRDMGIRLAIDDFGTGYSSLSQLKQLPIHKLKVDRSFVQDIPQDSNDIAITKAIILMAKSLQLEVIAEGIETVEQQIFLSELECDEGQGFLFSRPVPADEFVELFKHYQTKQVLNFTI